MSDDKNCVTLPNGDCVGNGGCMHDVQAGPLMVRHIIDGHEVLLPADARLHPKLTPDDPLGMSDPLGGTY